MRRRVIWVSACAVAAAISLCSQDEGAAKQLLQERIAELKQSMASNRAKLQKYEWVETTEISLKGETKKREQKLCHYGPDGQVIKTPIGAPSAEKASPRGLKGRIVEKKVDELKDYMQRVSSLVSRYVPPDPQKMQASFQAGKASFRPSDEVVSLVFQDYAKPGDKVTFDVSRQARKLQSYNVDTYLDSPQDVVTLAAQFAILPDGTNYLARTLLNATAKKIVVNTTNSNYKLIGQ